MGYIRERMDENGDILGRKDMVAKGYKEKNLCLNKKYICLQIK